VDQAKKLHGEVRRAGLAAIEILKSEGTLDSDHLLGLMTFIAGGAIALGKEPEEVLRFLKSTFEQTTRLELLQ
jgi:hypothetical protein